MFSSTASILRRMGRRLNDAFTSTFLDGRRALIIDEKYLGRDKKFVTRVIDGYSGEILWLKGGKGAASPDGFFRSLTPEQKEDIYATFLTQCPFLPLIVNSDFLSFFFRVRVMCCVDGVWLIKCKVDEKSYLAWQVGIR